VVVQPAVKREFQGEIVRKRGIGNFTLLEGVYRPNQVLPRHSHEHAYVSVALRGAYLERCGLRSWDCGDGGAIFHVAGESHSNRFYETGARLLILEIKPQFLAQLHEQGVVTDRQSWLTSPYCGQLALKLNQMLPLTDPLSALSAEGVGIELLSETLRPHFLKTNRSEPDWLRTVHEILHDRYREPLTLTELASAVSVHPVHLARAFRKRYDCCIGDLIRRLRTEAACYELLHSDASLAEIAARTGFTDQSHLCRILKRQTGVSPGRYRKYRVDA
jgi:AraC family transcriptional regulator